MPKSKRPHHHPNQHTPEELKLIRNMQRHNPDLRMIELWHRLRKRGYTRYPDSLFRTLHRLGLMQQPKPEVKNTLKPYEQMIYPGECVQLDVKYVPRSCISDPVLKLFQLHVY